MENKTAFIRTRIDPVLKGEVESMLHVWGITTTQAIDMFYRQIKRTHKFPLDLRFNAETELAIKEAKQEKGVKTFKEPEIMFKALGIPSKGGRSFKNIKRKSHVKSRKSASN